MFKRKFSFSRFCAFDPLLFDLLGGLGRELHLSFGNTSFHWLPWRHTLLAFILALHSLHFSLLRRCHLLYRGLRFIALDSPTPQDCSRLIIHSLPFQSHSLFPTLTSFNFDEWIFVKKIFISTRIYFAYHFHFIFYGHLKCNCSKL